MVHLIWIRAQRSNQLSGTDLAEQELYRTSVGLTRPYPSSSLKSTSTMTSAQLLFKFSCHLCHLGSAEVQMVHAHSVVEGSFTKIMLKQTVKG